MLVPPAHLIRVVKFNLVKGFYLHNLNLTGVKKLDENSWFHKVLQGNLV